MAEREHMDIYQACRSVPDQAKKQITDGRMKGKTDISPMWRIEKLTEIFGPCGIGWWYEIVSQRTEQGADGVVKAFVDINLYYKWGDEVSKPIPGIGGNTYIAKESRGLYTDDEAFKKALSDAISVAAKALGVGADVYMGTESTKYSAPPEPMPRPAPRYREPEQRPAPAPAPEPVEASDGYYYCKDCGGTICRWNKQDGSVMYPKEIASMSIKHYGRQLCLDCIRKVKKERR